MSIEKELKQIYLGCKGRSLSAARWDLARQLVLQDPFLLLDYVRWYLSERLRRQQRPKPQPISSDKSQSTAVVIGFTNTLDEQSEGPALALVRSWQPPGMGFPEAPWADATGMAGDAGLGLLIYRLVRNSRPAIVVETGVATGVTSAYVLAALADNGAGELHSIDLPPTSLIMTNLVGAAIPPKLRDRWHFHWGASQRLLPKVLRSVRGKMQVFIHDSDHSYTNMRWELESAWKVLAPGGWLVADDVQLHSALDDVAAALDLKPNYISQMEKSSWTGLLRKPD